MKRVGFLFEKITDVQNCRLAIIEAAKGKRKKKYVKDILKNVDVYAVNLAMRLSTGDFVSPYKEKTVKDGLSGKERMIQVPAFYPDQCAHHAIIQVLMPIILKSSYHWSCANIPNRGIDRACIGIERATRQDPKHSKYCVKMDIKKFYPSVDHEVLIGVLERKIKDKKALGILEKVIRSCDGLPIGNYTSPWFAELLLQPLDHFITSHDAVHHYVRYADDIVLIGPNKRKLRKVMYDIMDFLKDYKLSVKDNYQLFRIYNNGRGRKIDFVGKCFGINITTVRKRRALAFMRQSRRIQKLQQLGKPVSFKQAAGFLSRASCLRFTDAAGLRKKYFDTINIEMLKGVIRYESYRRLCTG